MFLMNKSLGPFRSPENTIRALSGDQTGEPFRPRPVETGVAPPRCRSVSSSDLGLGRLALGALMNVWLRRGMALLFVAYGIALGTAPSRA
jgi:hypothetical protein